MFPGDNGGPMSQSDFKKVLSFNNKYGYVPVVNGKVVLKPLSQFKVKIKVLKVVKQGMEPIKNVATQKAQNEAQKKK